MQAGHLPFVDIVRVRNGKATAVNIVDGEETSEVSARATGFVSILSAFQDKVSAHCCYVLCFLACGTVSPLLLPHVP